MIAVLRQETTEKQLHDLIDWLESMDLKVHLSKGEYTTIVGLVGDTSNIDRELLESLDIVEAVKTISEPFKKANRKFHPLDSIVDVGGVKVGGGNFAVMAGPCSVETTEQIEEVARSVKAAGAQILRGGAFKPRTSPYAFGGLEEEGLRIMRKAGDMLGMPICTEVMDTRDALLVAKYADIIQIGARNMQNFKLLREVGRVGKPVLLKRGLASTIEEWLMAAEYIMSEGDSDVILCERGIRTYETSTRNTFDVSAIPVTQELTHLPIIGDPSHASGTYKYVPALAKAAVAAGADGLMIEVHDCPECASSDGPQSLKPDKFDLLMKELKGVASAVGKEL